MENRQLLFGGFERLQDFPLDPSSIFRNLEELDYYVKNNRIAYPGQLLVIFSKIPCKTQWLFPLLPCPVLPSSDAC